MSDEAPPLPRTETYLNESDVIVHSPPSLALYMPPQYNPPPIYTTTYEMDADEREQYAQALANGCIN